MKTVKTMMWLVAALLCSQGVWAQNKPVKKERPRLTPEQRIEMKSRQMAEELMLDDATTAKFLPLYQDYLKEMGECADCDRACPLRDRKPGGRDVRPAEKAPEAKPLTDAEIEKRLKDRFARRRQVLDIQEKYFEAFSKFLTPQQVQHLFEPGCRHAPFRIGDVVRPQRMPFRGRQGRPACIACPQTTPAQ